MGAGFWCEWLGGMKLHWFWHLRLAHECTLYFPSAGFCTTEQCIPRVPWAACMGRQCLNVNIPINKHSGPRGAAAERLINRTTTRRRKRISVRISKIINRRSTGRAAPTVWWIRSLQHDSTTSQIWGCQELLLQREYDFTSMRTLKDFVLRHTGNCWSAPTAYLHRGKHGVNVLF